ncbi:MAG: dTDP-4-dehydrorhamnose 3,5-epimerase [Candidatus Saccharimonadales bacterium]
MALPTTEFTAHQTGIPGLLVFDVTRVGDERGWFQEKFHRQKLVAAGMPTDFEVVQNSLAYNKQKGITRGFHAEPWEKYISVVSGKVFVAYVDLRPGPTFAKVETFELDSNKAVFLPRGVGNSYQTLVDDTYYLYSVNAHWSPEKVTEYTSVNLADPDIGVKWPIALDQAVMSDRDKTHPLLKDTKPATT